MKFATVLMSVILAGVFANAQGEPAAPATQEAAKVEAPVKKEKKHAKKKHGKKEKKSEEGMTK